MAFVMFGVAIYFLTLLPAESHVRFLVFCLAIGVGAALYVGTRHRKAAVVVVAVGVAVALLTLGVIVVAVNSGM